MRDINEIKESIGTFELIERNSIYKGHITEYCIDTIKLPNGNIAQWDFVKHNGAAAILPVREDGKILMVRQYRHAIDKYTIEIPAGGINPGEDPYEAALRELEEETGYHADKAEHLIDIFTTVAFCSEKIFIYKATDLVKSKQHLDEDEFVNVEEFTIDELVELVFNGTIQDSKTICAIMTYKAQISK